MTIRIDQGNCHYLTLLFLFHSAIFVCTVVKIHSVSGGRPNTETPDGSQWDTSPLLNLFFLTYLQTQRPCHFMTSF